MVHGVQENPQPTLNDWSFSLHIHILYILWLYTTTFWHKYKMVFCSVFFLHVCVSVTFYWLLELNEILLYDISRKWYMVIFYMSTKKKKTKQPLHSYYNITPIIVTISFHTDTHTKTKALKSIFVPLYT